MTTHSSILAWRIPLDRGTWGAQSTGLQRIGHDSRDLACTHKHRGAGLHSEKVGRDSAPLSESPFLHSSFLTTQLHSFQRAPTPSTPSGPGGDTALIFSSTGQISQNVTTLLRQGPGGASETSGPTLLEALQPMSADGNHLGLKRQTSLLS